MTSDGVQAARLLEWGLWPRERPAQHQEYQLLVTRYEQDTAFAEVVHEFAEGMRIKVLAVSAMGVVLAPLEGSAYAFKAGEFRGVRTVDERLLDGLVQVAIAATVFPRAADLEEDAGVVRPPITVAEVEATLRSLAERFRERTAGQPDPPSTAEEEGVLEAWRLYERRQPTRNSGDGRAVARDTLRMIEVHLDRMCDLGCFLKHGEGEAPRYTPSWRYQILVKEFAATRLYETIHGRRGGAA